MQDPRSDNLTADYKAGFHKRLAQAFEEAGITQAELARRTGTKPPSVNDWFNRGAMPRGEAMLRLPEALGVSADWLFTGTGSRTRTRTNGRDPYAEGARFVVDKVVKALLQAQLEATGRESIEGADGLARLAEDMEEIPGAGPPPEVGEHPPEEDPGHEGYGT